MDMDFKWTTRAEKLLVVAYWWEQQQGHCCICFKPMDAYMRDGHTNPNAASIEHLIPRRENGPNTAGNVRLAHAACNHALGALWSANQDRAVKGLAPLSEKWALNSAKGRRGAAQVSSKTMTAEENAQRMREYHARKARGVVWCAANALSLPRGATLPTYKIKRARTIRRAAQKMTAEETARWLAEQGIKGA